MNPRFPLFALCAVITSGMASAQLLDERSNLTSPFVGNGMIIFNLNDCPDTNAPATTSATQSGVCGTTHNDGWLRWEAVQNGTATIGTCSNANFDSIVAVWDGTSLVDCNDDSPACSGLTSWVTFQATAGTVYDVQVGAFDPSVWGVGSVGLELVAAPPGSANDECADAEVVPEGHPSPVSNANATTSSPNWPCGLGGSDVWFEYTSVSNQDITISLCNSSYDTVLQAFIGDCSSLTSLGCNDDACGSQSELTIPAAGPGQSYRIRVGGYNGATGNGEILVIQAPDPQSYPDECADAEPLPLAVNTAFDTTQATTSMPWPCGNGGNDVWFLFTAPQDATFKVETCGSAFDTVIEVFENVDCGAGAATSIGCNDDDCGLQSGLVFLGFQGNPYYIRVGGFGGATGAGNLFVDVHGEPTFFFCQGEPNSTSSGCYLVSEGSELLADNELRIDAVGMPQSQFGYFLTSLSTSAGVTPPGSQGLLCLGGSIGRYNNQILNSGETGRYSLFVDNTVLPTPNGPTAASVGQTWYFSNWYRDVNPTPTSNFSDTIGITYQ